MLKNKQGFMNKHKFNAFTLAEMMVVMLIMSIILAAMAPVMTTKNKVDNSSPWKYSPNNSSDAYFGQGASMRAMIGQLNGEDTDNGKLIINNLGSSFSHILFKNGNTILGDLYLNGTSLVLGNRRGNNPIGNENINIGHDNWPAGTITGSSNITIGDASMTSLTTGSHNIGLGTTLTALTTGTGNVTIGDNSLISVTTGDGNIGLGNEANPAITTASKTIAIGANSVASSNGAIAIGSNLTSSEAHGPEQDAAQARVMNSIAIGNNATSGANNGGGQNSIAIGYQAKANSTSDSGTSGIAIGAYSNAGGHSIALGTSALNSNTTGSDNIAVGTSALRSNTTGSVNTALGENSLYANTTGEHNISIGHAAMQHNDTGSYNIAIGDYALRASDTGSNNIAIGREAMYFQTNINTGNTAVGTQAMAGTASASNYYNTAIGYQALYKAGNNSDNAGHNTAVGAEALYSNITGDYNTSIGSGAGSSSVSASYNTAIGVDACQYVTGSNKTCIGYNAGPASGSDWASDDKERIFIGSKSKFNDGPAVLEVHNEGGSSFGRNKDSSVVINGNLIVKGGIITTLWRYGGGDNDNVNLLARSRGQLEPEWNDTVSELFKRYADNGHGAFKSFSGNVISDRRLKYVGKESTTGLDKVRQLKVFNFTYKKDTTKTPHVGVIAQDLQKVFPNAVQKGKDGFLTIRMEDMFYAVINAIKELDAKYQAQEKRINELEKRIEKLEAKSK